MRAQPKKTFSHVAVIAEYLKPWRPIVILQPLVETCTCHFNVPSMLPSSTVDVINTEEAHIGFITTSTRFPISLEQCSLQLQVVFPAEDSVGLSTVFFVLVPPRLLPCSALLSVLKSISLICFRLCLFSHRMQDPINCPTLFAVGIFTRRASNIIIELGGRFTGLAKRTLKHIYNLSVVSTVVKELEEQHKHL